MKKHIVVLSGDGIGPEVMAESVGVLEAIAPRFGLELTMESKLFGGAAIDVTGEPLPKDTLQACLGADAILLAAIGGSKWDHLPHGKKPESGLLAIRTALKVFANLRPAILFPELTSLSCLRPDLVAQGLDILVVRELIGGLYFGEPAGEELRDGVRYGFNTMVYNEDEIRRIAHIAFQAARMRKHKVCSVDKANVLAVSCLWRTVVTEVHAEYDDVALEHVYVDNCAMQLIFRPSKFDVILTSNLFGDILSDEAAAIAGSLGLLPSASISSLNSSNPSSSLGNRASPGIFEPIHGSAPDIAGQDKANPLAMILSAALLLRMSFGMEEAAVTIENAVRSVLKAGYCTADIAKGLPNPILVGCKEMGARVLAAL